MDNIHISQKAMPLALEELKKHIPDFAFDVGKFRLLLETVKSAVHFKQDYAVDSIVHRMTFVSPCMIC